MDACRCFNDSEIGVLKEADWEVVVCNRKFWDDLEKKRRNGRWGFGYIFHESFHMIFISSPRKGLSDWIITFGTKSLFSPEAAPLGNIFLSACLCLINHTFLLLLVNHPPPPNPNSGKHKS